MEGGYTLSKLIADVPTVAEGLFDVAQNAVNFCTDNPLILFWLIAGIVSMGIGVAMRLFGGMR